MTRIAQTATLLAPGVRRALASGKQRLLLASLVVGWVALVLASSGSGAEPMSDEAIVAEAARAAKAYAEKYPVTMEKYNNKLILGSLLRDKDTILGISGEEV